MDGPRGETPNCQQIERLLVFFACEELSAEERAAVEHHVGQCPACAASLASELRLQQVLAAIGPPAERLDPHGRLLAQCRSELDEALDDAAQKPVRAGWLLPLLPANWFALRPAWSAALLILIGMALGSVVPQWYSSRMTQRPDAVTMKVAAPKDRNPGVRLKALEALRGFEQDDAVRLTLLDALQNDDCPGVRVEAINALQAAMRAMGEKGISPQDQGLVNVLRDRMERDPNNYIRMQSAAAIHQLGPRELH